MHNPHFFSMCRNAMTAYIVEKLFLMFRNFLLLLLVLIFRPLSLIVLPPTRLMQFSLLVIWLELLFPSASNRDAVNRFESIRVGDVNCVVRGGGPSPQKVFVYGYPVEGNSNLLTDALSRYGEVHDVRFRHWLHRSEVANGVRVVSMVRNQAIPRNLEVDGYHCKVSYYGQAKECGICEKNWAHC